MSTPPVSSDTKTCTLAVELSESMARLLGPSVEEAVQHLKELALIELFRQGEVSSGWAAEQLGMARLEFLDLLFEHDVPYFDLSEEELRQQVEVAMSGRNRSLS